MEPSIEKFSKKLKSDIANRSISSRGGERDTQDSFMKKQTKTISKGESYGTIIQMIKSDHALQCFSFIYYFYAAAYYYFYTPTAFRYKVQ